MKLLFLFIVAAFANDRCLWPSFCEKCIMGGVEIIIVTTADTIPGKDALSPKGEEQAKQLAEHLKPDVYGYIAPVSAILLYQPSNASYYTALPTASQQNVGILKGNWTTSKDIVLNNYLEKSWDIFLIITPADPYKFSNVVVLFGMEELPFDWKLPPRLKYTVLDKFCQDKNKRYWWIGDFVLGGRY